MPPNRSQLGTHGKYTCRDTLNSLEYLDAVVHEILRLNAPVPSTRRDATHAATIPLTNPVKGRDGKMIHEITIPKNSAILVCKSRLPHCPSSS